jgi:hypothetical protein
MPKVPSDEELTRSMQNLLKTSDFPDHIKDEMKDLFAEVMSLEHAPARLVKVRIGSSALTRDLVWCECGRGLSLSGKWIFCPTCGARIDQDTYSSAVEQAIANGASLYRDPELVALNTELRRRVHFIEGHNQQFERCESAWCHPDPTNDPAEEAAKARRANAVQSQPVETSQESANKKESNG